MTGDPRCYLIGVVLDRLQLSRRTFDELKRAGLLPMVEEILPRIGRHARYRADLIDRYLAGQWGQTRFFGRRSA